MKGLIVECTRLAVHQLRERFGGWPVGRKLTWVAHSLITGSLHACALPCGKGWARRSTVYSGILQGIPTNHECAERKGKTSGW